MSIISRLYNSFKNISVLNVFSKKSSKLIMLGLDAAGKTTILYGIKRRQDEVETQIPTIGFNVEILMFDSTQFTCWDVGGCDKIRPLWHHYTNEMNALVYVFDSNDTDRIDSVKYELTTFLQDDTVSGVPLLVLANKQDLPGARSIEEIMGWLDLPSVTDRLWLIHPTSAVYMTGIHDSFKWLQSVLELNSDETHERNIYFPPKGICSINYFNTVANDERNHNISDVSRPTHIFNPSIIKEGVIPDEMIQKQNEDRSRREISRVTISAWIERAQSLDELDDDAFIAQVEDFSLNNWDHYTHVRLAWILLTRFGLDEGTAKTVTMIRTFIENSPHTNGKSYHATMTQYWILMIAAGIGLIHSRSTDGEINKSFSYFLSEVGQRYSLGDRNSFKAYYTASTMFSAGARENGVPPDISSLPWIKIWKSVDQGTAELNDKDQSYSIEQNEPTTEDHRELTDNSKLDQILPSDSAE